MLLPKDKNNKKKTALALTLSGPGHKLASDLGEYEEILEDNQRALQGREMYPYRSVPRLQLQSQPYPHPHLNLIPTLNLNVYLIPTLSSPAP